MSIISLFRLGEWINVFKDTFCIFILLWLTISDERIEVSSTFFINSISVLSCRSVLLFGKIGVLRIKISSYRKSLKKMYHINFYRVHLAMSGIRNPSVSCDGQWMHLLLEIHFQTITTTTSLWSLLTNIWCEMFTQQGVMTRVKEYMS